MAAELVVETIRKYLALLNAQGIPADFAVLFGSHARGDAGHWSDIDLVVVSPYFDRHRSREDVERLWLATLAVDPAIEPVACGLDEWWQDDSRPILEIARTEGLLVHRSCEHSPGSG